MLAEKRQSRRSRIRNRIARLRQSNRNLRHRLKHYQHLMLVAGAATLLLGFALGFVMLQEPDPVLLGTGRAGVKSKAVRMADSLRAVDSLRSVDSLRDAQRTAEAGEGGEGTDIAGGEASYYGEELAGNRTASGERFNPSALTAAHRTLPLGSRVRVTNVRNGESVVVRINDRGPFAKRRVIDLSRGAATQIGLLASGTGTVRLELLRG